MKERDEQSIPATGDGQDLRRVKVLPSDGEQHAASNPPELKTVSAPTINRGVALNYFRKGESPMQHLYSFAKSFLSIACLVLFLGTSATFAQTDLFFGDGSDKDVTISIDTTLDHDMYYHNLTITSGKILYPDGFRIFVSGTLTLEDGAR